MSFLCFVCPFYVEYFLNYNTLTQVLKLEPVSLSQNETTESDSDTHSHSQRRVPDAMPTVSNTSYSEGIGASPDLSANISQSGIDYFRSCLSKITHGSDSES